MAAAEYGGCCTFCGAQLALSYSEHSQTNQPHPPSLPPPATPAHTPHLPKAGAAAAQPSSSSSAQSVVDKEADVVDKEADAVAFKNRLVGYDRNAAQRTKVIDDQSDYFEIDSNTWLSDQVMLVALQRWLGATSYTTRWCFSRSEIVTKAIAWYCKAHRNKASAKIDCQCLLGPCRITPLQE